MKVDYSQPQEALDMLFAALGVKSLGLCKWLAVRAEDGEILATFAFHNFGPAGCEMSAAVFNLRPSRHVLKAVFSYPFIVCGHRRLTVVIKETNKRSFDNAIGLGFRVEGLVRDWYPECNGILLGMIKEECKWLAIPQTHQTHTRLRTRRAKQT